MQTYEKEEELELRCPREYEIEISMLENLPPGRTHFRGVKSICALKDFEYFHVMLNCINDSMHSVLEGFGPVVSGNVLDSISEIEDKVTVGNINLEFAKPFGSLIVDKCNAPCELQQLLAPGDGFSPKMSAAQSLALIRYLPHVLCVLIENERLVFHILICF